MIPSRRVRIQSLLCWLDILKFQILTQKMVVRHHLAPLDRSKLCKSLINCLKWTQRLQRISTYQWTQHRLPPLSILRYTTRPAGLRRARWPRPVPSSGKTIWGHSNCPKRTAELGPWLPIKQNTICCNNKKKNIKK